MTQYTLKTLIIFALTFITTPFVQADLAPVIMPDADLVITVDLAKMRNAPIGKRFKEMEALKKELGQPDNMDKMGEFDKKLTQITGLKNDDFLRLTAAIEMDALDLDSGKEPDLVNTNAILGVALARVLTEAQLETGLKALAKQLAEEKKWDKTPSVTKTDQHGVSIFKTQKSGETEALYFAIIDNGKTLLMGTEMGLAQALGRQAKGEKIDPKGLFTPALIAAVKDADFSLIFHPTDAMRAKMKENADQPRRGTGAMFGTIFSQMKGLGVAVTSTDAMDVVLTGDFGDKAVAEKTRQLMDSQVISMVKMITSMAAGGKPMPFLQTMKASAAENGTAKISFSITGKDIDVFKEIIREQSERQTEPPVDGNTAPTGLATEDNAPPTK